MIEDYRLEELYTKYLAFTDTAAGEYGALEVAAIMLAQSLSIYKSALSETEYHMMVDNISNSRDKVKTFEKASLQ